MMQWTTKKKQRIVAATDADFETIRGKYFPDIPASKWMRGIHVEVETTSSKRPVDDIAKG